MEETKYLCLFDSDGRRGETYLSCEYSDEEKQKMLEAGFVEISEEEWNFYVGNKGNGDNGTGYVRDANTGKPVSAPAHIPTVDEKLAQLENQYGTDKAEIVKYFAEAMLADNTEVMTELKEEMADLEAEYEAKRQVIINDK